MSLPDFPDWISRLRTAFLQRFLPMPLAAEAWRKAGGREHHAFWMLAHPVHLVLARDHFMLPEPAPLLVSKVGAESIIETLNAHFSAQNLHFYLRENTWFVGLDEDPRITTTALINALNRDVTPFLPTGDGALEWAKVTNEIQMLLFDHSVNTAREAHGELSINSLWFDGLSAS